MASSSVADIDTSIACGLCMSVSPLEEYTTDNPFYCGILFCNTCVLELFNQDYDGWEYDPFFQSALSTKQEQTKDNSNEDTTLEPDQEQEEVELEMLIEEWSDEHNDDYDCSFDFYEHFGIPSDLPEDAQNELLEAAMGSS